MYYVYLLLCRDKSLYTGITTDLKRRLQEHKNGTGGHYTRAHGAVAMIYNEPHKDRSAASKREAEIKKMSRTRKIELSRSKK